MKFKKNMKKGFTLVELIVVIAIVAILAAVSVVSYIAFINSANESADIQLVKQLNVALQADQALNGPRDTMHEMLGAMEDNGFVVENLTKTKSGYDIVWDQENNRFALLNGETEVFSENGFSSAKYTNKWKFVDSKKEAEAATKAKYSIYLTEEFGKTNVISLDIESGLDVGDVKLATINYANNSSQTITIRTASASTTLNINAEHDTIKHYDSVGKVDISKIDMNCYYEYGTAAYVKVVEGKVVAKDGGSIDVAFANNEDGSKVAVIEENGTVETGYTTNKPTSDTNLARDGGVNLQYSEDGEHPYTETQIDNKGQDAIQEVLEEERKEEFSNNNYWIGVASESFAGGNGTEGNPYQIATAEQLSRLAYVMYSSKYADFQNKYYKLTADIDLSSKCWVPISTSARGKDVNRYFSGTFDGDSHVISGLNNTGLSMSFIDTMANDSTPVDGVEYVYGLFGDINGATIKNVNLSNVLIKNGYGKELRQDGKAFLSDSVGALVGYATGDINISGCHTLSGSVEGYDGVSGIVGKWHDSSSVDTDDNKGIITNCSNAATINAVRRAAGIVGNVRGTEYLGEESQQTAYIKVTECTNSGTITSVFVEDIQVVGEYDSNYYIACGIAVVNRYWGSSEYPVTTRSGKDYAASKTFEGCTNTGTIINSKANGTSTAAGIFAIAGGQN